MFLSKREFKDNKRSKGKKSIKNNVKGILIYAGGEKTEPNYFKKLTSNINKEEDIKVETEGKGKSPTEILTNVENMKLKSDYMIDNENIFIIIDKDNFIDFEDVIKTCDDIGYKCGWSNPCFEIWLLSHFNYIDSNLSTKDCIQKVEQEFKKKFEIKYEKNSKQVFELLKKETYLKNAFKNTKKQKRNKKENMDKKSFDEANPCTNVDDIIRFLITFNLTNKAITDDEIINIILNIN